jgi:hypothetical protein
MVARRGSTRKKSLFGSFSSEKEQNPRFLKKNTQKDLCSWRSPAG